MGIYQTYMLIFPNDFNKSMFDLVDIPDEYRYKLCLLVLLNTLASYIFEKYFIGWYNKYYTLRQQKIKSDHFAKAIK